MPEAPADFRAAVAAYDGAATVGVWDGPRYKLTYRRLGAGPPVLLVPGIASTYRGYALLLRQLARQYDTLVYDYPGETAGDGADLGAITHDDLVADLFGLADHLGLGPAGLFGPSFGSTIVLKAVAAAPERFPLAALQGGFARRRFGTAERAALWLGRRVPGRVGRLPFRSAVLASRNKAHFPTPIVDRWPYYVEQNGLTPIAPMAHRLDLVSRLDLRPLLRSIEAPVLLIQGDEDRVVGDGPFRELREGLPRAKVEVLAGVGHQPHYTHAERLAGLLEDWFVGLPAPG